MLRMTRWNPFEELTNLHSEMDRVFGGPRGLYSAGKESFWEPDAEISSGNEGWTVRMALPGIDSKDVHIDLQNKVLTVTGERALDGEKIEPHLSEIAYGRFERSFTLPENVAQEKVNASFEKGMLELTLPVSEAAKPRRIEIG